MRSFTLLFCVGCAVAQSPDSTQLPWQNTHAFGGQAGMHFLPGINYTYWGQNYGFGLGFAHEYDKGDRPEEYTFWHSSQVSLYQSLGQKAFKYNLATLGYSYYSLSTQGSSSYYNHFKKLEWSPALSVGLGFELQWGHWRWGMTTGYSLQMDLLKTNAWRLQNRTLQNTFDTHIAFAFRTSPSQEAQP